MVEEGATSTTAIFSKKKGTPVLYPFHVGRFSFCPYRLMNAAAIYLYTFSEGPLTIPREPEPKALYSIYPTAKN